MSDSAAKEPDMARRNICFPRHGTQDVLQHGDPGFQDELHRLYPSAEGKALEQMIELKKSLRLLPADDFWGAITEGVCQILGAELCFVMKRVLVDDQDSAVEMPPLGEPGSCMMATALHYCGRDGTSNTTKQTKFQAYGTPCAYMRHDKVFCIPDRLRDFITNNPNTLPTPCDAYIAVPIFGDEGKCFAHFGVLWSDESAVQKPLSWAFTELMLHSLEDMVADKLLQGANFIRPAAAVAEKSRIIPHDAVTVAQSLRPYAGSLSHELRTPMQGIVGMLDVMMATVMEATESQHDPRVRKVFDVLKDNIEVVQDSSRRAVEAADNVVHAYDMDLSVPALSQPLPEDAMEHGLPVSAVDRRPEILVAGHDLPLLRPNKRRREEGYSQASSRHTSDAGQSNKMPRLERGSSPCRCSEPDVEQGLQRAVEPPRKFVVDANSSQVPPAEDVALTTEALNGASRVIAPGLRHTSLGDLLQHVINEGLKMGGRPDSAIASETEHGEIIEVRTRGSDGTAGFKTIEWSVDPSVPSTMFIDERDLSKLISCVFHNALKFTDKNHGLIKVDVRLSNRARYISIRISDNGPGIPAAFLPRLFQPFAQGNGSITRSSEGLGLGLMVAKGIARKLGGDLMCLRAETTGPDRGTDFEIKVPTHAGDTISRPASPYRSPVPRPARSAVYEPQFPAEMTSPRKLTRALHEAFQTTFANGPAPVPQSTPPSPRTQVAMDRSSTPVILPSPPSEKEQPPWRPRIRKSFINPEIDRELSKRFPLTFLVAEDNKINRKLLVSMLGKFGYKDVYEAHDGAEAVRQMCQPRDEDKPIDIVLMDLWMPLMDGYEATERILSMEGVQQSRKPTVLAVTADVTDGALERAAEAGIKGFMSKPYKLLDLQRLITEYCASNGASSHDASPEETLPAIAVRVSG